MECEEEIKSLLYRALEDESAKDVVLRDPPEFLDAIALSMVRNREPRLWLDAAIEDACEPYGGI